MTPPPSPSRPCVAAIAVAAALLLLAGCAAVPDAAPRPSPTASAGPGSASPTASAAPSASPSTSPSAALTTDCTAVRAVHADLRARLAEAFVVLEPSASVRSEVWPEYGAALAQLEPTLSSAPIRDAVGTLRGDLAALERVADDPDSARTAINDTAAAYNALEALCT